MTDHLESVDAAKPSVNGLAEQDPEDHIWLMFGSHDRPSEGASETVATNHVEPEEVYRDPTLPQFRPDEAELSLPLNGLKRTQSESPESADPPRSPEQALLQEEGSLTPANSPARDQVGEPAPTTSTRPRTQARTTSVSKRTSPFAGNPTKARNTYYLWRRHDLIDAEANRRGSGGKLSFSEFRRKMVPEDEVGAALGNKDKATDEDKEAGTWESSADMGKLAFVGTWLEMASF
jgi:hypothetical protein